LQKGTEAGYQWFSSAFLMPVQRIAMASNEFWLALDRLVAMSNLIIDRPKGSPHPRHPGFCYPLDYGYLQGTRSPDGDGIDIWIGSLTPARVTAIIVTADLEKRDAEFKVLLGCTVEETGVALAVHNWGAQAGILLERHDDGEQTDHD
jgi:inorganic pyrophosphatase